MIHEQGHSRNALGEAERLYNYHVQDPSNEMLFMRAFDAQIQARQFDRLEEMLGKVPEALKSRADFVHIKGIYEIASGKLEQALITYEVLLRQNPMLMGPKINYAHTLALLGRLVDAEAVMSTFELADLPSEGAQLYLRVLYLLGNVEKMIKEARYWLTAIAPNDHMVAGLLSTAFIDISEKEEAKKWAECALANGSNADAFTTLAMLALDDGETLKAQELFREALRLDIRSGRAWLGLGMCALAQANLQEAELPLERAAQYFPGYIGTWHMLGWYQLLRGELSAAEAHFLRAVELNPAFADSQAALALVALMRGDIGKARGLTELSLKLDRDSATAWYVKSKLAAAEGNHAEEKAIVDRVLVRSTKNDISLLKAIQKIMDKNRG